jgi:hypothetical protein
MRSFGIVESKLFESDFFLEKLETASLPEAEYYLSAFLSATRAVTFALQASLDDHPRFRSWYSHEQECLQKDETALWAKRARNASQKEGATFIRTVRRDGHASQLYDQPIVAATEDIRTAMVRMFLSGPPDLAARGESRLAAHTRPVVTGV